MNDHFEWAELDFDGGLWSVGGYIIPPNGAAVMTDCYPLPTGGLRAWAKATTRTRAGIPDTHIPLAIFSRGGIGLRSGAEGSGTDFYLATKRDDIDRGYLWRWDESDDVTPYTAWELLRTFDAGSGSVGLAQFCIFQPSGGELAVYMTYAQNGSDDEGLWRIDYDDGAMSHIKHTPSPRALTTHQDRIVWGEFASGGTRIWYTDPGDDTVDPANFNDVVPDLDLSANVWAKSFFGELLLGKRGAPLTLVQGDITDPVVRLMSNTHHPTSIQGVSELPEGITYAALNDGYFVTQTGVQVDPLSPQIDPAKIAGRSALIGSISTNAGQTIFASPFFLTPTGHIYDYRTKSWFRTSEWGGAGTRPRAKAMNFEKHADEMDVHLAPEEEDFEILEFSASESQMERKDRYTYQGPPLRHPSGRRLVMREVQIPCRIHSDGARMEVTVNGTTRVIDDLDGGRDILRFPFMEESEYLDVTVRAFSGDADVEAPTLETIRLGTQPGHLMRPDTVSSGASTDNTPPAFTAAGDQVADAGVAFELVVEATDADLDSLTYSMIGSLPAGATFTPATRTFEWANPVAGTYTLNFHVTDNISGADDMVIELVVGNPPPDPYWVLDAAVGTTLSGSDVTEWEDPGVLSMVSFAATRPALSNLAGFNGLPFLRFSSTDYLESAAPDPGVPDAPPGSLFVVCRHSTSAAALNNKLLSYGPTFGFELNGSVLRAYAENGGDRVETTDPLAFDTSYLLELHSDGADWSMLVNGVAAALSVISGANTGAWFDIGSSNWYIERSGSGGNMDIAEIRLYETLTADEKQTIRDELMDKYAL